MTVNEVRKRYLDFFEKRGHAVIPSAPIVPENDPTTLFTSSGMQPLVPYLLGQPHPEGTRLVNSQMSFRAGDIEEVGDNRHTTFFEMLGNWSLGDYFKKEQLPWVYEFLTEELRLPKDRLWVTCFAGDEALGLPKDTESAEIWKNIGMPEERILFYDAKKNWWSRSGTPEKMPAGEPGGPDSEIFYEFTNVEHDPAFGETCHPNCDCGRFMEIGNSVFMEYIKNADGSFGKLPKQNVDFGGGLERLTAASQDNADIFSVVGSLHEIILRLQTLTNERYEYDGAKRSFRVIADHVRGAVFMISGGVRPSNTEQGYILRRLLRRAYTHAEMLGMKDPKWISTSLPHVVINSPDYEEVYPELKKNWGFITEVIQEEIKKIHEVERKGNIILEKRFDLSMKEKGKTPMKIQRIEPGKPIIPNNPFITPEAAFDLHSTHGLSLEKILMFIRSKNYIASSDFEKGFEKLKLAHQAKSRAGAAQKFAGGLADHAEQTIRYHTAHHILLKALQMVLGKDVHQRGSNITSERLRIDFSYGQKMTPEQKAEVEKIVNEKIAEAIPVIRTDMKKEEAEGLGAEHEFGATYPDTVSVYSVGPLDNAFSIEFCGGPHVSNTSELKGTFKILKEEASSAGVRRIKAVLE